MSLSYNQFLCWEIPVWVIDVHRSQSSVCSKISSLTPFEKGEYKFSFFKKLEPQNANLSLKKI